MSAAAQRPPARAAHSRRPLKSPIKPPKPLRAVLLYQYYETGYLASLGIHNRKQVLIGNCRPTAPGIAVYPLLHLCPTQPRYIGQCNLMLQTPAVEGRKEQQTGLRVVPLPEGAKSRVSALYVADYKPDYRVKGPGPAAVLLEGKPEGNRPGWLLLLVTGETYLARNRAANEATAIAALWAVLPMLPEWLAKLPVVDV